MSDNGLCILTEEIQIHESCVGYANVQGSNLGMMKHYFFLFLTIMGWHHSGFRMSEILSGTLGWKSFEDDDSIDSFPARRTQFNAPSNALPFYMRQHQPPIFVLTHYNQRLDVVMCA